MIRFAYPNIDNHKKYIGCGRFFVSSPEVVSGKEVIKADPDFGNKSEVMSICSHFSPASLTSEKLVYETKDNVIRDPHFLGDSLDLAFLLALINRSLDTKLDDGVSNHDIWCTGEVDIKEGDRPFLRAVYPDPFDIKLQAFLSNNNQDKIFFIPAANFEQKHEILCREDNVKILTLKELQAVTNPSDELFHQKTIIKIQGNELAKLIGILFNIGKSRESTSKHRFIKISLSLAFGFLVIALAVIYSLQFQKQKDQNASNQNNSILKALEIHGLDENVQVLLELAYNRKMENYHFSAAVSIIYQTPSGMAGIWEPLKNGDNLSSIDSYRIIIQSEKLAFFYVFQIDAIGKLDWIFPANHTSKYSSGTNPIPAAKWIQIPGDENAFHLDDNLGIEHIYFVATGERWIELENVLKQAAQSNPKTVSIQKAFNLKTRGIGGTRQLKSPMPKNIKTTQELKRVISSKEGIIVFEKWFQHVAPMNRKK